MMSLAVLYVECAGEGIYPRKSFVWRGSVAAELVDDAVPAIRRSRN